MKYIFFVILTLFIFPSFGQEIEKIVFTSQQADEPPTNKGTPKYSIKFKRLPNGELATSEFYENKKRKKLNYIVTIDKAKIEKAIKWKTSDIRTFSLAELGLDIQTVKKQPNAYNLNFEIPNDLVVNVDSFQFCQNYKMTKSISLGGETLTVLLIDKKGLKQKITFDSNDVGQGNFNLKEYILCYTLLSDKIPNEFPSYDFFSKNKFTDIILYYQKTIECEGYYYQEFINKNPEMTSQDKRMMKGWNFIEYLIKRSKKR